MTEKKGENKLLTFIKENRLLVLVFLIVTAFFAYQHYASQSWDFNSYVMNARYFFYNGTYYEVYRAPLASIFLAPFIIFGFFGEFLYIILVSLIFLYANIKLSDIVFKNYKEKTYTRLIFYLFSFSPFIVLNGLSVGTELFALSFLELFLVFMLNKQLSGHFLGLAFLVRYNLLYFTPLLLFTGNIKKIIKNILLFLLIIAPWFIYNYFALGNWLYSIIDSYALNVLFRQALTEPFPLKNILHISGFYLPFILFGISIALYDIFKKRSKSDWKNYLLFSALAFIVLYDCFKIPFKIDRYLFNLSLPFAFFSTLGILFLAKKYKKVDILKISSIILIIIFILSTFALASGFFINRNYDNKFKEAADKIKELGMQSCAFRSPHWVLISYYTENTYPGFGNLSKFVDKNETVILFLGDVTYDDSFTQEEVNSLPYIYKNNQFIFLGNATNSSCEKKEIYNHPLLNTEQPCQILAEALPFHNLSHSACLFLNKH
jgi:hypothetical protein